MCDGVAAGNVEVWNGENGLVAADRAGHTGRAAQDGNAE
jgi:hypothetical protein